MKSARIEREKALRSKCPCCAGRTRAMEIGLEMLSRAMSKPAVFEGNELRNRPVNEAARLMRDSLSSPRHDGDDKSSVTGGAGSPSSGGAS